MSMATLTIGAQTYPFCDLWWGIEQALVEDPARTTAMQAGKSLLQSNFASTEAVLFCKLVCIWGRGQRVFANLTRHHGNALPSMLANHLKRAHNAVDDESAIAAVSQVKGLGVSFGSKHLRLLMPGRFGVLDSLYCDKLGFTLNDCGYSLFMKELRAFAAQAKHYFPDQFCDTSVGMIENGLFFLVQPRGIARLARAREVGDIRDTGARDERVNCQESASEGFKMTYDQLLSKLRPCRDFSTLARRSRFKACNRNGELQIINSGGVTYRISRTFYDTVLASYESLQPDHRKASQNYTDTGWDQCPGRVQAPYLPAIWEVIDRPA